MWPLLRNALLRQRGQLLLWAPVMLGSGVGMYFALKSEPSPLALGALCVAGLLALWRGRLAGEACAPLVWALGLVVLGVAVAGARAHLAAAPVMAGHYYGPIEGRVVAVDRSGSGAVRVLLEDLRLPGVAPRRTPARARIALHGDGGLSAPEPGMRVMTTGHLSAPAPPSEPGGFDFRRHAWFQRLGAVGYTRVPLLLYARDGGGLAGVRSRLARGVETRIGGPEGAFAAAITAGDRSGLERRDLDALRAANLAHLLAISGLHMALLTGFVFLALRQGAAVIPGAALHLPLRKLAAVGAIAAGAAYLALSGGAVSTERAFIMVTMMLAGLLADRRALTLRAVALAALIVLVLRPYSLLSPGFQMSFAATTALIVVFAALRGRLPVGGVRGAVLSLFVSSLVAGLATAPFSAAHFNQIAHYGLLANMLSVPVMGSVVMPAAVAAAVLEPLGLAAPALWAMKWGLHWILLVAHWVAGMPGAVAQIKAPGAVVLPLLTMGALFAVCWQGRARWLGAAAVLAAGVLWSTTPRPPVLVAQSGGLVGVLTPQGRALSRATGDGFAARIWLENDGDPGLQADAAARPAWQVTGRRFRAQINGVEILLVRGKTELAALQGCGGADVLISNMPAGSRPCTSLDAETLARTGPVAIWPGSGGTAPRIDTVQAASGQRLWSHSADAP